MRMKDTGNGQPGIAYVMIDGTAQPERVRAFHVTDHDITTLARRFTPPTHRRTRSGPLTDSGSDADRDQQ
jgi:S-DNA-T family DNA segregation ATPase FtsK/SpoIIIE